MSGRQQLLAALNVAFSQKYHSLAQYILDAQPYVRPEEQAVLTELAAIADSDRTMADQLAETIESLEGIPQVDTCDHNFANLNYLALSYLLGVLIADFERQLGGYQASLDLAQEEPRAREILQRLCTGTQEQLQRLTLFTLPLPPR